METYEIILDLVEYPEKYSPSEVREILSNPEMKGIYEILCKTSSALHSNNRITDEFIDTEWQRLNTEYSVDHKKRKSFARRFLPSSRIASLAVIILTSMIALAVGIAVKVSIVDKKTHVSLVEKPLVQADEMTAFSDTATVSLKEMKAEAVPMIFEDTSLEDILKTVSEHYNVALEFKSQESAGIHLFYKFDFRQPLEDIIEQLNTFDRIDIKKDGNILIVE